MSSLPSMQETTKLPIHDHPPAVAAEDKDQQKPKQLENLCTWTLGPPPDAREDEEYSEEEEDSEEEQQEESDEEDEDQSESGSASSSISTRNSPVLSFGGSTTGISSMMETSEHLRAGNSAATLDDDLFHVETNANSMKREEFLEDEGNVSDSAQCPLDVDVNFVISLDTSASASISQHPTPIAPNQSGSSSPNGRNYTPLKHHLQPICTIGTGTFGRVELTRHRETGHYFALKSMYIPSIVERRQVSHVFNEKRILSRLDHPFIVKIFDTAKDSRYLHFIMEFLAGGELFSYLRMTRSLPSAVVKFYAAEIVLALEYLHNLNIAYRDLKPENLMLTQEGHIKLTDFGFAKEIHTKSYSLCGTCEYLAPELASRKGHNHTVDYWALGVLVFELIGGHSPFHGNTIEDVQARIRETNGQPEFPRKTFSANAKDLITGLLTVEMKERLGSQGTHEIKEHAWFAEIDFEKILNKKAKVPIIPTIYSEGDTGNFDTYQELEKQPPAKQRDLDLFDEW